LALRWNRDPRTRRVVGQVHSAKQAPGLRLPGHEDQQPRMFLLAAGWRDFANGETV